MNKNIPFPKLQRTLWQLIGPSIIFVALSLNGGELLLWPSLVANFSLKIIWPLLIILVLQFVVNLEIERYTLVTGRSTEANLVGSARWLAGVFALSVIVSLVWPAWMTTAGNLIATLTLPGNAAEDLVRNVGLVGSLFLLLLTIAVFKHRGSYKIIETISKFGLIIALSIILITVALNFQLDILLEGARGLISWGFIPAGIPRFDFLAALAYGGVAGVLNLVQSEWVMAKKYGVAGLTPAQKQQVEHDSPTSRRNFREWFRMVNKEHFLLFFCANIFSIFLLSYLGRLLLPLGSAQGFGVLAAEIRVLNLQIFPLGTLFGISATMIFIMANVAILDAVGRLTHRLLQPWDVFARHRAVTPQNISILAIFLGVLILALSLVFPSFKQPFFLLVTSASLSGIVMWLYPPLLLKLNLGLPLATRPSLVRMLLLIICTLFYGAVSLWALSAILPWWLVVVIGMTVTLYQIYFLLKKNHNTP